ncbi:E3 ubiquitin-protein ligase Midline-1-like [Branchiostoma floridae x Branchiostoma japonicum]
MEGLEEELTCPVCLELFTCPIQLPCHHNICRRCAEVFLQTETDSTKNGGEIAACSAPSNPQNEPDSFLCPTCRNDVHLDARGLDGLKRNLLLQNIVDRYKNMKTISEPAALCKIPCQLCKLDHPKEAVKSCKDCRASYCEECLSITHPQHPPFSEHKLVDPRTSFEEPSQTAMCPDHPTKPVEMYCVQDQTPVCLLCEKVGRHKQHNMAALEEVFSQRRAELQGRVDRLGAWLTEGEEKVREMEKRREHIEQSAVALKDAIEQECEALHEVIRQRAAEMKRQVALVSDADEASVQQVMNKMKDEIQKSRTSFAYAQEVLKETDPGCFLQNVDLVMNKLDIACINDIESIDCGEIKCDVENLIVDLSEKKEQLKTIDFGARPKTPVILNHECKTTTTEAYINWQHDDDVNEYHFYYDVDDAYRVTCAIKGDSFTAKNLAPETTYTFRIYAINQTGTSSTSSVELTTKPAPESLPVVPNVSDEMDSAQPQPQHQTPYWFELCQTTCGIGIHILDPCTCMYVSGTGPRFVRTPHGGCTVLGDTPISAGRHFWEVTVKSRKYNIGVAYGDMPRDRTLFDTLRSWALELSGDRRYALTHNGDAYRKMYLRPKPRRIGVLLDYDRCRLSFFNQETLEHIGTMFQWRYTQPLYPAFSLWGGELTVHTGLICPDLTGYTSI